MRLSPFPAPWLQLALASACAVNARSRVGGGEAGAPGQAAKPPNLAAAIVDDQPILVAPLQRQVRHVLGDRAITPQALTVLQAEALRRAVDQRLVMQQLERQALAPSAQDVALGVEQLESELSGRGATLEQYLQQSGLAPADLHREIQWRVGWRQYLKRYLTDENLQRYFQQHRRDFDGTHIRAAHILWVLPAEGGQEAALAALAQAGELQDRLQRGELTFEQAARQFSQAPTAPRGGELGWLGRREPMPEAFSQATFQLEQGEVSRPVKTVFGVHLIKCLEIRPGEAAWTDVRDELAAAAEQHLFQYLADGRRAEATIRFTGQWPYFDPLSGQLVVQQDQPHEQP